MQSVETSGGETFLEVLKAFGVEYIFSSPGSEWVPVWEALAKLQAQGEPGPRYINCRHESLAVSMAMGYSQATGRLPAVLLHSTVGTLQGAMAIRAAYHEQLPLLICAGDSSGYGEDEADGGLGQRWLRFLSDVGGPAAMARPFVKWSQAVTAPQTLLGHVYRACQMAQTYPKGPVLLSIPWEFLLHQLPAGRIAPASPPPRLPVASPETLEVVARWLLESQNPIILTEHVGLQTEATARLIDLAEILAIPVFESLRPTCINFPKDHPLHAGYDAQEALKEADLVLVVAGTAPWLHPSASPCPQARVVLLDDDPIRQPLPYLGYRPDLTLACDVAEGLASLVELLRARVGPLTSLKQTRLGRWQAWHRRMTEQWEAEARAGAGRKPVDPAWFIFVLNQWLPSPCFLLQETITHSPFINQSISRLNPGSYFDSTGGLGMGLGLAAGVKLAHPQQPVIVLEGDGSFNYNPVPACMGLFQEYHLPVLILVLNNGGYAAMKTDHLRHYPNGWAARNDTYFGVDIVPTPDYAKLAEAFNAHGERVEDPEQILPSLNRAVDEVAKGKSALLDVILDPRDTRRR